MNSGWGTLTALPWRCPAAGEVVVWRLRLTGDPGQVASWLGALPPIERERAARFRHRADAERFVLGRTAVRRIIGRCLGTGPDQVELVADREGKLHLGQDGARWEFNLSHSGRYVLVAVAWARPVGVDVEQRRPDFPEEIAARCLAPEELADLYSVPAHGRMEVFYALWTRKEAVLKARGLGLGFPLQEFSVSSLPGRPPRLQRWSDEREPGLTWRLWSLELDAGHAAALAVRHEPDEPTLRLSCRDGLPA